MISSYWKAFIGDFFPNRNQLSSKTKVEFERLINYLVCHLKYSHYIWYNLLQIFAEHIKEVIREKGKRKNRMWFGGQKGHNLTTMTINIASITQLVRVRVSYNSMIFWHRRVISKSQVRVLLGANFFFYHFCLDASSFCFLVSYIPVIIFLFLIQVWLTQIRNLSRLI